jgi:hypothetical protein
VAWRGVAWRGVAWRGDGLAPPSAHSDIKSARRRKKAANEFKGYVRLNPFSYAWLEIFAVGNGSWPEKPYLTLQGEVSSNRSPAMGWPQLARRSITSMEAGGHHFLPTKPSKNKD